MLKLKYGIALCIGTFASAYILSFYKFNLFSTIRRIRI